MVPQTCQFHRSLKLSVAEPYSFCYLPFPVFSLAREMATLCPAIFAYIFSLSSFSFKKNISSCLISFKLFPGKRRLNKRIIIS